jgi:chemotaxis protein histidine kinase CheA
VHTFKGLFNQFSFGQTPRALHALESQMEELRQVGPAVSLQAIAQRMQAVPMAALLDADLAVLSEALGPEFLHCGDRITLSAAQALKLQQLAVQLLNGESVDITLPAIRKLLSNMKQLHRISLQDALHGFDRLVVQTAARLDKEIAPLRVTGVNVWMDQLTYKPFLRSLTHVFRNAVVHGIEDPDARLQLGKHEVGSIDCAVRIQANLLQITISDDGSGIDLLALRQCALGKGYENAQTTPTMSDEQLAELVFQDNISTLHETSELAGRGVGLAVVRSEARKLGGDVQVRSTPYQGTQFVFTLPMKSGSIELMETN